MIGPSRRHGVADPVPWVGAGGVGARGVSGHAGDNNARPCAPEGEGAQDRSDQLHEFPLGVGIPINVPLGGL